MVLRASGELVIAMATWRAAPPLAKHAAHAVVTEGNAVGGGAAAEW